MRKNFFVTSLAARDSIRRNANSEVLKLSPEAKKGFLRLNAERKSAIRLLARKQKRIILSAPKMATEKEKAYIKRFVESLKKSTGNTRIRILWLDKNNYYANIWQRDISVRLGKRILNKSRAEGFGLKTGKEQRFFADGGRLIQAGTSKGKKVLFISISPINQIRTMAPIQEKILREEMDMLRRRGYVVFELPGFEYKALGRRLGEKAKGSFFEHLDVFINTIPEKKLILVNPDYYKANLGKINQAADYLKYKIITVPESEKYTYPSNFLPLGNGEILIDKGARITASILKKNGVKVYEVPQEMKGNNQIFGGIRCFINED
ncbi:MAG: hypothetical protein WC462_02770 [archaeon]